MSETDFAYLAGLFDGEGTVHLRRQRAAGRQQKYIAFRITMCGTDHDLMRWVQSRFGGVVYPVKVASPRHRPQLNWYAPTDVAFDLLRRMLPYLRCKRRQAEIALAYADLRKFYGVRERVRAPDALHTAVEPLIAELRILNRRGAA